MSELKYDVVIIGAGLSGSAAATLLAEAGIRTLLVEAATMPQDKMCGEFLSPECGGIFERLGVMQAVDALGPTQLTSVRVTAANGERWDMALPEPAIGLSRYALDDLLFHRALDAGAAAVTETRAMDVAGSLDDGMHITLRERSGKTRTVQAQVVLGAWGRRGSLDRVLDRPFLSQKHPTFGLKAHYYGPPLDRRVELHGFDGGYCGLAEVEGGRINLCLLAETRKLTECGGDPEEFARQVLTTNPALGNWLAQATRIQDRFLATSQIPFVPKRQVERDVLLLGDSAGLITPLAGNGMAMAMAAAEMAAPLVQGFLDNQLTGRELAEQYTRAWQQRFRTRMTVGRMTQPLLFRPLTLGLGLRLLRLTPPVGRALVSSMRDSTTS